MSCIGVIRRVFEGAKSEASEEERSEIEEAELALLRELGFRSEEDSIYAAYLLGCMRRDLPDELANHRYGLLKTDADTLVIGYGSMVEITPSGREAVADGN